jgi:undecaprenyl-diphosphatase
MKHSSRPNRSEQSEKSAQAGIGLLLLGALVIAVVALIVFGWLAQQVIAGDTQQFDQSVRAAVHSRATPILTAAMQTFSFLGSAEWMIPFGLAVVCVCIYFRRNRMAVFIAITMLGADILDSVLKLAFHRPRPVAFYGTSPGSYSFPSGHALASLCFYGIIAAVLADRTSKSSTKVYIWLAAILLVGMIGLSRIYLGVHYPSDVIAGYLAATVWVTAVASVDKYLLHRRAKKQSAEKII